VSSGGAVYPVVGTAVVWLVLSGVIVGLRPRSHAEPARWKRRWRAVGLGDLGRWPPAGGRWLVGGWGVGCGQAARCGAGCGPGSGSGIGGAGAGAPGRLAGVRSPEPGWLVR